MNAGVAQWSELIQKASQVTGVPSSVIAAVMTVESGGNAQAKNPSGATGLMQIMPSVWNRDGKLNLYDPYTNILKGAQILAANYRSYGSWNETFQRYYGVGNRQVSGSYAAKVETALNGIPQGWGATSATPSSAPSPAVATNLLSYNDFLQKWGLTPVTPSSSTPRPVVAAPAVAARPVITGDALLAGAQTQSRPTIKTGQIAWKPSGPVSPQDSLASSLLDGATGGISWQQQTRW